MKQRLWLLCSDSPGLVNDAHLLAGVVNKSNKAVAEVIVVAGGVFGRIIKILTVFAYRLFDFRRMQVGIFLEDVRPFWLQFFARKILVPNPEWIRPGTVQHLQSMDAVWCKTTHALSAFQSRALNICWLGFTSRDCFMPEVAKDYRSFLHLQGRSMHKGTLELLTVWSRHPEWPALTVVSRDRNLTQYAAPNIALVFDYISDERLFTLMNASGVHVCVSTVEGFGHSINEAMSCASVVLTTDAPPMNELVTDQSGFLVASCDDHELGFSMVKKIDILDLEKQIQKAIDLPLKECERLGVAARESYLSRDRSFRERALSLINELN